MSSRTTKTKEAGKSPRTPKDRGAARKTPARNAKNSTLIRKKDVTNLCLDILRKINGTPSSCASPLPDSLTQEEKHEWIQTYINSITPNRVDYKKSPTRSIITKLPRNSIFETKEDPKLKMLMEKFKEPHPKKIERIDYEKNEANYEEQVNKSEENPSGVDETKKPADEINNIASAITYEEFLTKQEEEPETLRLNSSNIDFDNPVPGTSKQSDENQTEDVSGGSADFGAFITMRTPARKRHENVIELDEDSDVDDSIQVVKVIPARKRVKIPNKKTEPEVIVLDTSTEKEEEEQDKGLGECPICFERLGPNKGITATYCGHIYCTPCIRSSLKGKKSCPKCRKRLNVKKIHPLYV